MEQIEWIKRRRREDKFPNLNDVRTPIMYATYLKKCGYYGDSVLNYTEGIERALDKWT